MPLFLSAFKATVDAILIVIVITGAGALLTNLKVLNPIAGEVLSKISITLLLPCLVFCEIAKNLTLDSSIVLLKILLICTIHILVGCVLGYMLSLLIKAPPGMRSLMAVTVGFQDTTAVPLIFAVVLGDASGLGIESDFSDTATEYVLLYTAIVIIYKWTLGFKLLEKKQHVVHYTLPESVLIDKEPVYVSRRELNTCGKLKKLLGLLNPPVYAAIIALPFALIPYVREYFLVDSGSVLGKNVYAALTMIGSTASPVIDMVLGIHLSRGCPHRADITWVQIFFIFFGKMICMPAVGYALMYFAYKFEYIVRSRQNRVLTIMMLIVYACPTSLQMLMVCMINENNVENISKVYLVMYPAAIVTLSVWTTIFLITLY